MNISLAYKIISLAESRPSCPLRIRGRDEAREVHQMAAAGLIEENDSDAGDANEATITRITHAGHHFYRALRNVRCYGRG